jgi:DNA-binding NarL/FixJ family response regulator
VTTEENPSAPQGAQRSRARRRENKIQLLLVDEHPLLRAGVKTLLDNEDAVEVVGEADSIDQAVDALGHNDVDVVLMDVDEATPESVDDMRRLRDEMSDEGALVVFARKEDDDGLYRAVVGGASGLVGENAQPEELVATIEQAADGEDPISKSLVDRPEVGRRVLEAYAELSSRGPFRRPPKLNERELAILTLAAQGQTNQQIGKSIGVSEHTVKSAISLILARLGLRHRTEAVVFAIRNGWITVPLTESSAVENPDGRYARPGI